MLSLWKKEHYAKTCLKKNGKKSQVHTQMTGTEFNKTDTEDKLGYVYHQRLPGLDWKTCLLINSESSVDVYNNAKLLTNMHPVKKLLKLHCNAGYIHMTQKGWFGGIEVWYHPKGIAHILSHKILKKRHHIEFIPHESSLHYLDLNDKEEEGTNLVTTIQENFQGCTKKQVEGAIKACQFQAMLGHPSRKDFESMVHANLIANCRMTQENIFHAFQ